MDSTHQTNHLEWYLYNICVRDEQGSWCPVAHILTAREDSDITAEGLKVLKKWCGGCWHLRYMNCIGHMLCIEVVRGLCDLFISFQCNSVNVHANSSKAETFHQYFSVDFERRMPGFNSISARNLSTKVC